MSPTNFAGRFFLLGLMLGLLVLMGSCISSSSSQDRADESSGKISRKLGANLCSFSKIGERWALTASHCNFEKPDRIYVGSEGEVVLVCAVKTFGKGLGVELLEVEVPDKSVVAWSGLPLWDPVETPQEWTKAMAVGRFDKVEGERVDPTECNKCYKKSEKPIFVNSYGCVNEPLDQGMSGGAIVIDQKQFGVIQSGNPLGLFSKLDGEVVVDIKNHMETKKGDPCKVMKRS